MKKIFAFAASLLLAVGCTAPAFEENINNNENGEYDVLYAAVDNEASKVLIDALNDLSWNAGDEISVWHNTNNKPYVFKGADGDKVGEFKYKLFGSVGEDLFENIYALYPYAETSAINEADETISYTIPAEQTYREGTVAAGAAIMTAIAEAGTKISNNQNALQFKNAMSFLRVKLYGNQTVTAVAITANNGEALAGNVTISHDENNIPAFTVAEEGASSTLTLNCGEGVALDKEETTTFWMAIRPVVLAKGLTIKVTTTEKEFSFPLSVENLTFERNKINSITRNVTAFNTNHYYVFKKATSVTSGKYYALVAEKNEQEYAATALTSNYGYLQVTAPIVEGAVNDDTHRTLLATNAYLFTKSGANFTIQQNDGKYVYQTGSYNSFNVQATLPTDGAEWSVAANTDGTFTITNVATNKWIQLDKSYGTYGCYNAEKGTMPVLYELVDELEELQPVYKTVTVAEFLAAAESSNVYYTLTGEITGTYNTTYGNFYLKDATGTVQVYGLLDEDGEKCYTTLGLVDGDTITIEGLRGSYSGSAQMKNALYISHVVNENPRIQSIDPTELQFDAEGGDKTVEVETFGDSTFDFTINYEDVADWLTVTEAEGVITVTADKNTDTESGRDATIEVTYGVSTEIITISQSKASAAGADPVTVSLTMKDLGLANSATVNNKEIKVDENVTLVFKQGTAGTAPAYYTSGYAIRMYQNGATLDVTANGKTITSVKFTYANNMNYLAADSGTMSSDKKTWTGSATAIKFTCTGTNKNQRAYVAAIEVTYE